MKKAPRIAAIVAGSIAAIAAVNFAPMVSLAIIIYPDRKALHRKTIGLAGMLLPDWFIGDNTRKFVLITSPTGATAISGTG